MIGAHDHDCIAEPAGPRERECAGLLPSLVIAGAPKSGTSSVFRWLTDHPDVVGSSVKETYYFVDPGSHMFDSMSHFLRDGLSGYRKFFPFPARAPKMVVEATPSYLYSDLALRELPNLPSAPHFLFLLREPASQIHSIFRYFQSNWDWIDADMSFAEFLSVADAGTSEFYGNELARHAINNARYIDFLSRWSAACGKNRIHVFLFEDVLSDPRRFMQLLARRFSIDPDFYDDYEYPAENQTYTVRSRSLQKLNVSIRSWLPQGAAYNALRGLYRRLNTKVEPPRDPSGIAHEAALAGRFITSNQDLAREFELDLAPWRMIHSKRLEMSKSRGEPLHAAD
jgi:hypothetical protein